MGSLDFSKEEKDTLIDALEGYLSDLRMQIADTDSSFFREELKAKKMILVGILDRLTNIDE